VARTSPILRRGLVLAAIASSLLLGSACSGDAAPEGDAPAGAYVALGDSYSSGVGARRYISGSGHCLRSRQSWVYQLGRDVSSFRACAGGTTASVLRGQLDAFPADTGLVTITIGGNDAGFVDVVASCLLGSAGKCGDRVARAERFVRDELPGRLRRVYDAIRERAPDAIVVVAGYPRLFALRPWCYGFGDIDDGEQRQLNAASDLLARTTAAEVGRHSGFRFVDVRAAFDGGGVCASTPLIHGVTEPLTSSFHPTVAGFRTYALAIRSRL
jgi:lysophospholipase L1-like esterase